MTAPAVSIQFVHRAHDAGAQWIQMNVAHRLLEIGVLLADDGFVAILKQVPVAAPCRRLNATA